MSMELDGFDDIFDTVEILGDVGKRAGKKAVKSALDISLNQLKTDSPRAKKNSSNSADKLAIQYIKNNKNGSAWGSCGIGSKNWEDTKGLWYQHFGYENHVTKDFVDKNVGWMTKGFEKVKAKAEKEMLDVLNTEIDKVIK